MITKIIPATAIPVITVTPGGINIYKIHRKEAGRNIQVAPISQRHREVTADIHQLQRL